MHVIERHPFLKSQLEKGTSETDSDQDSQCSKWGMWARFSPPTRALSGCPGERYDLQNSVRFAEKLEQLNLSEILI